MFVKRSTTIFHNYFFILVLSRLKKILQLENPIFSFKSLLVINVMMFNRFNCLWERQDDDILFLRRKRFFLLTFRNCWICISFTTSVSLYLQPSDMVTNSFWHICWKTFRSQLNWQHLQLVTPFSSIFKLSRNLEKIV